MATTRRNYRPHLLKVAPVALIFGAGITSPVYAAAQSPDPAQTPSGLGEIVVTANKTKENISKVPISILAYDAAALKQSGVKSIVDIASVAPGVQFDQSAGLGAGTNTNIAIRGISSSVGTSTTGIYLDDIPLQTRVASLSYFGNPYPALFDLDRLEVERGPQGTLFGAGAEGGAVRFITRDPSVTSYSGLIHSEFAATQSGAPSYEGGFALGGPIIQDKLGFRVSAWDRRDGGYIDRVNPLTGDTVAQNANWTNTFSGRAALLFTPNEAVKITPSFFGQVQHNNDSSSFYLGLGDPSSGNFQNGRFNRQPATDKLYLPSLKVEIGLPGDLTLTSVSSYMMRRGRSIQDTTGIFGTLFGGYGYNVPPGGDPSAYEPYWAYPTDASQASAERVSTHVNTFNQEVRLSNAAGSRLKWTIGGFFSRAVQTDIQQIYSPWIIDNVIDPVFGYSLNSNDYLLLSSIKSTDKQTAGFGQVDWKATDKLTVTVGGRYSHAIASYKQGQSGFLSSTGDSTVATQSGTQKQNPWSGKVGVAYQLTPGDMIYASASRGYRMGGANQPINSAPVDEGGCGVQAPPTYGSDKVNSYEAGVKGRIGNSLRFDADVFYVQWKNIQESLYLPCAFGYITNAGDARTRGFDASVHYALTRDLTLHLSASYVDAKFTKTVYLPTTTPGDPGSLLVAKGDKVGGEGSSPWNVTASLDYRFEAGGHDTTFHVENVFKSHDSGSMPWEHPIANSYSTLTRANPATDQVNVRMTTDINKFEISAYVNNLNNSHPTLYRYQEGTTSLLLYGVTFRPRTFGLSVDYKF